MKTTTYAHWDEDRGKMVFTEDYAEMDATNGWAEYEITQLGPQHFRVEATQWFSGWDHFKLDVTGFKKEIAVEMAHAAAGVALDSLRGD